MSFLEKTKAEDKCCNGDGKTIGNDEKFKLNSI